MQKQFTKILVPVCFNADTRWSVMKAVQIANRFACDVHLLCAVANAGFFSGLFTIKTNNNSDKLLQARDKMKKLLSFVSPKLKDGLLLTNTVTKGAWHQLTKETVIREHADLVILPKSFRRFGNPLLRRIHINQLSRQTRCPVMMITREFTTEHLDNIIVPVNDSLPVRKLALATYLSQAGNSQIHLMATDVSGNGNEDNTNLMKAYQMLSVHSGMKVHCSIPVLAEGSAESTLAYARNVDADLIVVNSDKESRLSGWWNQLLGKYLYNQSDIPVLTICGGQGETGEN